MKAAIFGKNYQLSKTRTCPRKSGDISRLIQTIFHGGMIQIVSFL